MTLTAFFAIPLMPFMAARTGVTNSLRTVNFLVLGIGLGAVIRAVVVLFALAPALFVALFLHEAIRNIPVARIFPFEGTRNGYITLKTLIGPAFGDMLALPGPKIAAT